MEAGTLGRGGEVFILDMGEPVRILDLARDMIELSGLRPDEDVEIAFTGMRPGEKLFEELSTDAEHADKTRHPKIFVGRHRGSVAADAVDAWVAALAEAADAGDPATLRTRLRQFIPEYTDPVIAPPQRVRRETNAAARMSSPVIPLTPVPAAPGRDRA
jgi:FlaA1/EpsC-like NDP-sugar epimerase